MKTPKILFWVLMAGSVSIHAQTSISLTFSATLDGGHHPMDSIYVENLTRGGDTMLYGNDTVLLLQHNIGMTELYPHVSDMLFLSSPYPNPGMGSSSLTLLLSRDHQVTLWLHDLYGRELACFQQYLQAGEYTFLVHPGCQGQCFVSAEASGQRKVQKIISVDGNKGEGRIVLQSHDNGMAGMRTGTLSIPWVAGDTLRYTGYAFINTSHRGHGLITDHPVQSKLYTFNLVSGIPCLHIPFVTDIDGNAYKTVQIGNQCWIRENLRVTRYRNGIPIPNLTSGWSMDTIGYRCWYDNDSATHALIYGALYNFYAVKTGDLCPAGWHVPSDAEWQDLEVYLGMTPSQASSLGQRGTNEGGKLKEADTLHWASPNFDATNESGFTALPAGNLFSQTGAFQGMPHNTYFFSSTSETLTTFLGRGIGWNSGMIGRYGYYNRSGYAVRCLKD